MVETLGAAGGISGTCTWLQSTLYATEQPDGGIVAAQTAALAAGLVEAGARASQPVSTIGVEAEAANEASKLCGRASDLRVRLEFLAAELSAVRGRQPADLLFVRSEMEKATLRAAIVRQASATAALHGSIAIACGDVTHLTGALSPSLGLTEHEAATARSLSEAGLYAAVLLLQGDLAGHADRYTRHALQRQLPPLYQRLQAIKRSQTIEHAPAS